MNVLPPIVVPSPDGTKSVSLEYEDEIRFGPAFYRASGQGFQWPLAPDAVVGRSVQWSPDSRYAVIPQFLSQDGSQSPKMSLLAIDTATGTAIEIARNDDGLIHPLRFLKDGTLEYKYYVAASPQHRSWKAP